MRFKTESTYTNGRRTPGIELAGMEFATFREIAESKWSLTLNQICVTITHDLWIQNTAKKTKPDSSWAIQPGRAKQNSDSVYIRDTKHGIGKKDTCNIAGNHAKCPGQSYNPEHTQDLNGTQDHHRTRDQHVEMDSSWNSTHLTLGNVHGHETRW